jgi:hypothetical protein
MTVIEFVSYMLVGTGKLALLFVLLMLAVIFIHSMSRR